MPTMQRARLCALCDTCRLRKRWLWRHEGATKNPGPGPETTLCVTDIENSTLLWEELDAQVMDTAVKTHNVCIRKLAAKYKG